MIGMSKDVCMSVSHPYTAPRLHGGLISPRVHSRFWVSGRAASLARNWKSNNDSFASKKGIVGRLETMRDEMSPSERNMRSQHVYANIV